MGMIVSNNQTLENIRTGQEVPYNIGLLIIGECINSSLQMKFEEGSFLGKCDQILKSIHKPVVKEEVPKGSQKEN